MPNNESIVVEIVKLKNFHVYRGVSPIGVKDYQVGQKIVKSTSTDEHGNPVGLGNYDPHWQGLYAAEHLHHAASYAVDNNSGVPGGLFKIKLPEDVRFVRYENKDAAQAITPGRLYRALREEGLIKLTTAKELNETHFNSNQNFLTNELGKEKIILIDTDEFESFTDINGMKIPRLEFIIPWNIATEQVQVSEEVKVWYKGRDFSSLNAKERLELMMKLRGPYENDLTSYEAKFKDLIICRSASYYSSGSSCLDWEKIKTESQRIVKQIIEEHPELQSHSKNAVTDKEKLQKIYNDYAPKIDKLSSLKEGVSRATTALNIASWAAGLAETFSNKNADGLDKAAAVTAIIPGLGQAVGIANGIEKHDGEAIAINSIALSALVVAQAIPIVGEIADVVGAGLILAGGLAQLIQSVSPDTPPHVEPPHFYPQTSNHVTVGWLNQKIDEMIHAWYPHEGYRSHHFVIKIANDAPENTTMPITEIMAKLGSQTKQLDLVPERVWVYQNNNVITCTKQTVSLKTDRFAVIRPLFPTMLTKSRPIVVRMAYITGENSCTTDANPTCFPENPAIAVRVTPLPSNNECEWDHTPLHPSYQNGDKADFVRLGYRIGV
ncbi:Diphtheria toxin, C domain [Seinonella peptonophila]|uniref:Diphtheria toxin, C domain n=1 Tax=Seinonella peptonophila TaxID=112248 RepID=A0A1M4ZWA4_9BACL|nr:hypothetical protein [Seinonella peptonophila]7RB4_A Chain A, Diphtheria toxin, C domain [Seinonella peptonophila]SHF22127.1 Diphtheria toxin, C domain [Seinonella peptonophila]